jgi:hypothetical protein
MHMETCLLEYRVTLLIIWQQKWMFWLCLLTVQNALPELLPSHLQTDKTTDHHRIMTTNILTCHVRSSNAITHFHKLTTGWLQGRCNRTPRPKTHYWCHPWDIHWTCLFMMALYHCQGRHITVLSTQYGEKSCSPWDFSSPASDTLPLQPQENTVIKLTAYLQWQPLLNFMF